MSYESIRNTILDARLDEDQLIELNQLIVSEIKAARQRQARHTIHKLRPGGRAKVVGRLRGDAYLNQIGEVIELKRTRVLMRFDDGPTITVPASVLAPHNE